jgi:hypothetical protein
MADRNPGPVKPPTIDLVAREAVPPAEPTVAAAESAGEEPGAEPKRARARKAKPAAADARASEAPVQPEPELDSIPAPDPFPEPSAEAPATRVRPGADWGQIGAAAVIGALFGTALTYIVATIVPMPSRAPVYDNPAPVLADQSSRIGAAEERLGVLEESAVDIRISLDATIAQLDSGMAAVRQEIAAAAAAAAVAQPPAVDTSAIDARLRALSARLDAVAAGASSADAGALAENLSDLEQALAMLRIEVEAIGQRADAAGSGVTTLEEDVDAIETQIATLAPPPPPGPSIGEVALNGLEAAFAAGRPFASELEALTRIAPGAVIPQPIGNAARTGLPAPDAIVDRFAAIVPDMLAANRPPEGADWLDTATNWLTSLLAIRPAGEVEGATPDAVMARLEAAMERRDFVAADALFAQLPADMRTAARDLPADVALHAEAAGWIETLRKRPAEVAP